MGHQVAILGALCCAYYLLISAFRSVGNIPMGHPRL
jgi:hypothetical protein